MTTTEAARWLIEHENDEEQVGDEARARAACLLGRDPTAEDWDMIPGIVRRLLEIPVEAEQFPLRAEVVATTSDLLPGFAWQISEFSFGKWRRVRQGFASTRALAETRAAHVLAQEQECKEMIA